MVTVADAEVVGAVYGMGSSGGRDGEIEQGDPADKIFWLTINDVIEKANDTDAARVQVDWPAGQDYPNSVFVDGDKGMADDETSYTIANVEVTPVVSRARPAARRERRTAARQGTCPGRTAPGPPDRG